MHPLRHILVGLILVVVGTGVGSLTGCVDRGGEASGDGSSKAPEYVGPTVCGSCHGEEHGAWTTSDHHWAMLEANDSTVLGDFDDAMLRANGIEARFLRKDGAFIIHTQGADGAYRDHPVRYVFGHYPLQQYLVEFPNGRLQVPRESYDVVKERWFHQYEGDTIPPNDWMHWTRGAQNWNSMCATCHSTDLQRNYDVTADSYRTTWSHINVSCESCHGPGSEHVAFMSRSEDDKAGRAYPVWRSPLSGSSKEAVVSTCMPCHSRRAELFPDARASLEPLDHFMPALPDDELYFPDGQIKEEVYVYGSFLQSVMHKRGVTCTNCHDPHNGQLLFEGNALCMQCHEPELNTSSHTFHAEGSSGPSCVNCHMPARTYMGNDERHDHGFRVPRPDLSVRFGVPNTCNQCHSDRTAQWASDHVDRWYGSERKHRPVDDLLPGSLRNDRSFGHLSRLFSDTGATDIQRATAIRYLGDLPTMEAVEVIVGALDDEQAMVRHSALVALHGSPPDLWAAAVAPLLKDPVRAVRIAAIDLMDELPKDRLDPATAPGYASADAERMRFLTGQLDFPSGRIQLADHHHRRGELDEAVKWYLATLDMDGKATQARLQLAAIGNRQGRNNDALRILRDAARIDPRNPRVHYDMALLLAEMGLFPEALAAFEESEGHGGAGTSLYRNHAALLQQQERYTDAAGVLEQGLLRFPESAELLIEMVFLHLRTHDVMKARKWLSELDAVAPDHPRIPEVKALMRQAR
ncbi:MAG: tetratricopeptide repeat protein [Flavobacteriales bacterium]|nr:tetratricopeptide repeat protein [Flavobacteriales bacterium]